MSKVKKIILTAIIVNVIMTILYLMGCIHSCKSHLNSCHWNDNDVYTDEINGEIIYDTDEVAVGSKRSVPENQTIFIPYYIEGHLVTQLGYENTAFMSSGFSSLNMADGEYILTFYAPSSIKKICPEYAAGCKKVFYCGQVVDLSTLYDCYYFNDQQIYVPADEYDKFLEVLDEDCKKHYGEGKNLAEIISKANLVYDINYDDDCYYKRYYYIDYINNGEKVTNIPPVPTREGYEFDGWYIEEDCIIEWNFDIDVVETIDGKELRLYAKWIKTK